MVRMLGVLAMNKTCGTGAVALAVGRSVFPFPGQEQAVPVLFRKTLRWDSSKDYYADKLMTTRIKPRNLLDMLKYSDDTTSSEAEREGPDRAEGVFRMTWEQASVHRGNTVAGGDPKFVLGILKVILPCVLFRGHRLCEEVEKQCSDSFIRQVIAEG
jgi:hypothetical protein